MRAITALVLLSALNLEALGQNPPNLQFPDLSGLEEAVARQLAPLPEIVAAARATVDSDALGEAGRLYQAYGFLDIALACYAEALTIAPQDFRWRYYRASAYAAAGKLIDAVTAYEAALELRPADIAARIHLGETLFSLGRPQEARSAFEAALATAPETAAGFAGLGQVALSEQRFADAIAAFERALELAPQAGALRYPLALAQRGMGNLEAARRHLEARSSVGVRPPDPLLAELETLKTGEHVFLARGRRAFSAGSFVDAEASFRGALAANPGSTAARINLATTLDRLGRMAEAQEALEQTVREAPQNPTARLNLGLLLSRLNQPKRAQEHLREAVRGLPEDAEARLALARVCRRLGQHAEAATLALEAIALAPENEPARLEAAGALIEGGQLAEAVSLLRSAQRDFASSGAVAHALVRVLVAAPQAELRDGALAFDLAGRLFEALASADHATLVAAALAELDRCDEAAQWQRKALELASAAPQSSPATAQLESLLHHYEQQRPCRALLVAPAPKQ